MLFLGFEQLGRATLELALYPILHLSLLLKTLLKALNAQLFVLLGAKKLLYLSEAGLNRQVFPGQLLDILLFRLERVAKLLVLGLNCHLFFE